MSVILTAGMPEDSSEHADWGTDAHELAALVLKSNPPVNAAAFSGRVMGKGNAVDQTMIDCVNTYADYVERLGHGHAYDFAVETELDLSEVLGVPGEKGTADVIAIHPGHGILDVVDLKGGRGVRVDAQENEQLLLYAAGALYRYKSITAYKTVRMHIVQPRFGSEGHISVWELTPAEIMDRVRVLRASAMATAEVLIGEASVDTLTYSPGEKQCQWCRAKASCPALTQHVYGAVADAQQVLPSGALGFDDLSMPQPPALPDVKSVEDERLATMFGDVPLIQQWCEAVKAETYKRLNAGKKIPGFKLAPGRAGKRRWADEAEAEKLLKSFRLKADEMYSKVVISPTTAETMLKDQPKRWAKVEALITRSDSKPTIVRDDSPVPTYTPPAAIPFEDLDAVATTVEEAVTAEDLA